MSMLGSILEEGPYIFLELKQSRTDVSYQLYEHCVKISDHLRSLGVDWIIPSMGGSRMTIKFKYQPNVEKVQECLKPFTPVIKIYCEE